ncbi:MAG: DEAD/DEAH box helicase [Planctomycetota bacterium]
MSDTKIPFAELGLSDSLLNAVAKAGYEHATPIQAAAIPVILQRGDLIGCAQTGTGKTAAFTLPTLDRLLATAPPRPKPVHNKPGKRRPRGPKPDGRPTRCLILSPTRELAAQIGDSLAKYGKGTGLRHSVIYGGVSQYHQVKSLQSGVDTVIATPGRLLDLKNQGHVDLSKVEVLIFDEADQMLDMGFLPDLKRIVAAVPKQRQTLMFSATMPKAIRELAQQWLNTPKEIAVAAVATPADRISQSVHLVDRKRKPDLLAHFLKETPRSRTLVFSRTKHGADKLVKKLSKDGVKAAAIHGNKSQGARNRALAQFKSDDPPVLVATDIAARGLDIRGVSHVVNFDLPETPETYVHRIGRTARAGAEGVAVSFCSADERGLLRQIERLIRRAVEVETPVAGFEVTERAPQTASAPNGRRRGSKRPGGAKRGASGGGGGKTRRRTSGQASAGAASGSEAGGGKPKRRPGSTAAKKARRRSAL